MFDLMSEDNIVRKIAVIFVTDVVGFSKLMEKNEEQTLRSFRACKEILDNLFEEHGGRIFNTAGDSVLAEFQSAVSAVI
ncbi:MAG TPA: adenylate/guanylate cyclase domain-containing protein, partial [Planctomycetaceae bacterium]|nr:adenylate/guanylate cyclase domain-containing protein [Planctomycetaceae bacterium]